MIFLLLATDYNNRWRKWLNLRKRYFFIFLLQLLLFLLPLFFLTCVHFQVSKVLMYMHWNNLCIILVAFNGWPSSAKEIFKIMVSSMQTSIVLKRYQILICTLPFPKEDNNQSAEKRKCVGGRRIILHQ